MDGSMDGSRDGSRDGERETVKLERLSTYS